MTNNYRLALIDLKTTGLHVINDRITEVAVIIISEMGIVSSWHQLINPKRTLSREALHLTVLTNTDLCEAPEFKEISTELFLLLQDCVLVAHNVRFDLSFLKNEFKRVGLTYQTQALCTIRLFRKLEPFYENYHIDALAVHYGINASSRHQALDDANILYQLLMCLFKKYTTAKVLATAKLIYQKSSLPPKLKTCLQNVPETCGVYFFYTENSNIPLYIGKSVSLRQRILSHFQNDYLSAKEFNLSQQVERIEFISTPGELSALLLESKLIKEYMPIYNKRLRRKKEIVGFKLALIDDYLHVSLTRRSTEKEHSEILGAFSSMTAAKEILIQIVKEFDLCPKLCGLENTKTSCFSFHLKRCNGACISLESSENYNKKVQEAFKKYTPSLWPYKGMIAIKEICPINQTIHYLIFNQWRSLGVVNCLTEINALNAINEPLSHQYDVYKILKNFLTQKSFKDDIIELNNI